MRTKENKLFTVVLELTGEVSGLKAELGSVGSDMKGVTDTVTQLTNKLLTAELGSKTTKTELAGLRSSLAGLTTNLISTKTQTDKIAEVRQGEREKGREKERERKLRSGKRGAEIFLRILIMLIPQHVKALISQSLNMSKPQ